MSAKGLLIYRQRKNFAEYGEILFNNEECISSISGCVNHFVNNSNKTEIIFGINNKDYDCVISKINTENCVIETVKCDNL